MSAMVFITNVSIVVFVGERGGCWQLNNEAGLHDKRNERTKIKEQKMRAEFGIKM